MVGIMGYRPVVGTVRRMATQAERRTATRLAILEAARSLFANQGYEATSVSDILDAAALSRGAMYHHFKSKEDVFAAVFVQTSSDAIRQAATRVSAALSPRASLVAGCLGWLDAVDDPKMRQILLVDGPVALGWERARLLEEATSLGVMRACIRRAVPAGRLDAASVDLAARFLSAALTEAALGLGRRDRAKRRRTGELLTAMINGLCT